MRHGLHSIAEFAPTLAQLIAGTLLSISGYLLYLIYDHRDGRAFGTKHRPDLDTLPGLPLLGNMLQMIGSVEKQLEWWTGLRKAQADSSRPLSITLPGMRLIDISNDVECLQAILKDNFEQYEKVRESSPSSQSSRADTKSLYSIAWSKSTLGNCWEKGASIRNVLVDLLTSIPQNLRCQRKGMEGTTTSDRQDLHQSQWFRNEIEVVLISDFVSTVYIPQHDLRIHRR